MRLLRKIILAFLSFCFASMVYASELDNLRKVFVDVSVVNYAPSADVTERFIHYSDSGRANDVLLLQLYMSIHLPDYEVEKLLKNFDWDAKSWTDIDYAAQDRGRWPATLHVTRLYSIAKLYKAGSPRWKNSPSLQKLLHDGMAWWFENMPKCPNWWHNDIGVPKKMTAILLMLRDELTQSEIDSGLKVLERSKFGRTGQNKVWLAGNNLMKGLLIDDEKLVMKARDYIAEEIYLTDEEGIQKDWSFHQHGPQIQFGNYGLAYADGLAFWLRVLKNTKYDFSSEQKEIANNLIKEGISWSVYKGVMDPSFCGRQNFINGGTGKAYALAVTALNMAAAIDEDRDLYTSVAMANLLPEQYDNTLVGAKYYWRSDCGIYRTPQWYASIRMHSERTIGFEFTNKENTLANFSADGALILMQTGVEFLNIFAYWDWRKIPGVTSYEDGKPIKCDDSELAKRNYSSHVGGLVQGDVMVTTMELNRDGLHAFKSVFFFNDCVINLGSDIKITNPEITRVTTAVDQIHLEGNIVAKDNWVYHARRAYVSLDDFPFSVTTTLQRGKWDSIDPAFKDKWDEGRVFKCYYDHPIDDLLKGKTCSYAYLIIPDVSEKEASKFAKALKNKAKSSIRVLVNDKQCQAVQYKGVICAVFHQSGHYTLAGQDFKIEKPSIIIKGKDSSVEVLPEIYLK